MNLAVVHLLVLVLSFPFLIKSAAVQSGLERFKEEEERFAKNLEDAVTPNVGPIQSLDPQDFPITGLTPQQALDLLFERYKARMLELHEPRMFGMEDSGLSDKEVGELCGSSASLECGKKVLKYTEPGGESSTNGSNANIHRKCNLRKDFLDCIDVQRRTCRRQAEKGIYPRLPPKSIIRSAQSKIWRALWTSGGCVLAN